MASVMLETIEFSAPDCWASYLINGDASGLEQLDIDAANAFVQWVGCGSPVDCIEDGFRAKHHASHLGVPAAQCALYTFITRSK